MRSLCRTRGNPTIHEWSNTTEPTESATLQSPQSNSGQSGEAPLIAPGSVIPVQLAKSIDAKKVKTGDEVEAKVTEYLKQRMGRL